MEVLVVAIVCAIGGFYSAKVHSMRRVLDFRAEILERAEAQEEDTAILAAAAHHLDDRLVCTADPAGYWVGTYDGGGIWRPDQWYPDIRSALQAAREVNNE